MPEWSWRWGGGCKCGLVHFSTCSLLHFCPSQQPIHLPRPQFPPLYTITVFPFSALTFSHFQVMTLIGPREPNSSSPHPSSSKWKSSAQLFSTHLFDSTMVQSFLNASLPPPFCPSCRLLFLYLLIKINNLCRVSSSTHRLWSSCLSMCISGLFFSPPTSFPHISVSTSIAKPHFFCCTVRIEYANRFKSNYLREKEPARLSVLSNLIGFVWAYFIQ